MGGGGGPYATRLTFVILGLSVLGAVLGRAGGGAFFQLLMFRPAAVLGGYIWQPLTYTFIIPLSSQGIFGFLISLYFLYIIGSQVEGVLGSKRFLQFFVLVPAVAAVLTIPFAFIFGFAGYAYSGLWVALGALTILFAHNFANQPIYLMFVLPVQGKTLILIAFGIVGLYGLVGGFAGVFPALLAMLFALAYAKGVVEPRRAWLRFRAWRIEKKLKKRTSRFSVIDGDRKDDDPPASQGGRGPWIN